MEDRARGAVEAVRRAGADQASARVVEVERHELNVDWDEVSLLRSTVERRVELLALVGGAQARLTSNEGSAEALASSADRVVNQARASRPDEANTIAPASEPQTFESGPTAPDLDVMHDRLQEFLVWRRAAHPSIHLRSARLEFVRARTDFGNSHGVRLAATTGVYRFGAVFSARAGADVSSFNFTGFLRRDLGLPLAQVGSVDRLMRQVAGQLGATPVGQKFLGDLVVTPDALGSLLDSVTGAMRDNPLISGTSMFQQALGKRVADPRLSLHAAPIGAAAAPTFFTQEGYVTRDETLIDAGVLRAYLLTSYGARKTGHARGASDGEPLVVDAGDTDLDELIGGVRRGVLLCRFSGGRPSDNGDFSGIAKNSYLIEDGRVTRPLAETMVAANLGRLLEQVVGISRERVDFGAGVFPWVRFEGVSVS